MNDNTLSFEEQEVKRLRYEGLPYSEIGKVLGFSKHKANTIGNSLGLSNLTYEKECPGCKKKFKTNNIQKKHCAEQCKKNSHNKHRSTKRICKHCGDSYRSYTEKEHCTMKCKDNVLKRVALAKRLVSVLKLKKECVCCNKEYFASVSRQMYCSSNCNEIMKRKRKVVYYNAKCKECGKHYTTSSRSVYCSELCSKRYSNRYNYFSRYNNIKSNGIVEWDISVEKLSKRDKGTCYLCNNKVDFNDYHTDDQGYFIAKDYYPSIDHIKPISKGGTHTWDNVKLAHRICNTMKSNNEKTKEKQLELI